ncbi:TIGR02391 family protein [Mycolicibacterium llatzerense]|uniref:TIGR02391 family protein n=1 Tax=Mycolicibacterium llatzerense TaxID=280871 RepID=UPI0013A6C4F6|nr:TIGR02391 family protein [Mycolicibacterium llatzerense]
MVAKWVPGTHEELVHARDQVGYNNTPASGVAMSGTHQRLPERAVAELTNAAEQFLYRVPLDWRTADDRRTDVRHKTHWNHLGDWASRGIAALRRQQELREKLGDDAPKISASRLHPWVWSGSMSLWRSHNFRSAVDVAAKNVNAETRNKMGRRDVSETHPSKESLGLDPAASREPRLSKLRMRRMQADGSVTSKSMQRGAMALAGRSSAEIRNPFNHENPTDIDEQTALEHLAALRILSRSVEESTVERAW